nr:LysR substrate-binding domain-containing protein [uncultured Carboxylicivirga sp.]
MDYRDKVFLSVAENLSFSKAADELFISQPAITKHIKELERRLNITLFDRKGNKIYLTEAGKLTYSHLKKIEQQYRELEFEIGRLNDTFMGELKIGASSTISQYLLPKAMASFHKRYPQIELYLSNGNSFEMEQLLIKNEIDMALVENASSQSNIKYMPFMDDELIVVTGSESIYAKQKSISLADFKEIPLVLREKGSGTLDVIKKALQSNEVNIENLNTLIHLGSTEAIKNFLKDFDGIAVLSDKAVTTEIYLNQLVQVSVKGFDIPRKLRFALHQGQPSHLVELFMNHLSRYNF